MTAPTESNYESQARPAGGLLEAFRALPLRAQWGLIREAAALTLSRSVSDSPEARTFKQPFFTQRMLRGVLLARGLCDHNELGSRAMAAGARRMLRYLRKQGPPPGRISVPVFDLSRSTPDDFFERFVRPQRPVVIRGHGLPGNHMDVGWFVEKYGQLESILTDREGRNYNGHVRDLLVEAPSGGPFYVHNHEGLFREHPEVVEELGVQQLGSLLRTDVTNNQHVFASVKAGTRTPLHCASQLNTLRMLEGRKRWMMVDPIYFLLLYPYLSHTNGHQVTLVTDEFNASGYERWPLYEYCPTHVVDLEAGDVLLVPRWWYHSASNLSERTMAMAIRWGPWRPGEVNPNRLFSFLGRVANRSYLGSDSHQDMSEIIAGSAARATWGLT